MRVFLTEGAHHHPPTFLVGGGVTPLSNCAQNIRFTIIKQIRPLKKIKTF